MLSVQKLSQEILVPTQISIYNLKLSRSANKDPRFSLDNILNTLRKDAKYNDKNPIKYYRNTYHCVPPWVLFKGIFLSTLVNFVRLFKEKQKNELACKMYGLRDDVKHIDAITNLLLILFLFASNTAI